MTQDRDYELESVIAPVLQAQAGTWAVSVRDLKTGRSWSYHGQERFNAASVIKVPILVEVFRQAEAGRFSLDQFLSLPEEEKVPGSGVLKELHAGLKITIRDAAVLMIVVSDNTATNLLMDLVGIDNVNRTLDQLGCCGSRLRRKLFRIIPGVTNEVTANDMSLLLESIHFNRAAGPTACRAMVEIMLRQQYREKLPRFLPPEVRVAHKTGEITGVAHDVGLVLGPGPEFAIACLSSDLPDGHQGNEVIGRTARAVYDWLASSFGFSWTGEPHANW